jgi:hypothetical protein
MLIIFNHITSLHKNVEVMFCFQRFPYLDICTFNRTHFRTSAHTHTLIRGGF